MSLTERYPMGATVVFGDGSATTSGEPVVATGSINGPPVEHNDVVYVPVYAVRDNGREATTVYVVESNVLEVLR